MVDPRVQVLARWDYLERFGEPGQDLVVLGANAWPTGATEVQVNLLADPGNIGVRATRLLTNVQLAF